MEKILAVIGFLIGISAVVSVAFFLITKSPHFLTYNNYALMGLAAYITFAFLQFSHFRNFFLEDHTLIYLGVALFFVFFGIALVQIGVLVWAYLAKNPFFRRELYIFLGIVAFLAVLLAVSLKKMVR